MSKINAHDENAILEVIDKYRAAIHTQNEEDFASLWSKQSDNMLISIRTPFEGTEAIVRDFLGVIRDAYTSIELISDDIRVHRVDTYTALAIFQYHTVCVRRDDGSDYGIEGVETQVFVYEGDAWKLHHVHYSK